MSLKVVCVSLTQMIPVCMNVEHTIVVTLSLLHLLSSDDFSTEDMPSLIWVLFHCLDCQGLMTFTYLLSVFGSFRVNFIVFRRLRFLSLKCLILHCQTSAS